MRSTSNQSVWDIALITAGSIEASFEVAQALGIGVTDTPGMVEIPAATVLDTKVKQAYDALALKPASNI